MLEGSTLKYIRDVPRDKKLCLLSEERCHGNIIVVCIYSRCVITRGSRRKGISRSSDKVCNKLRLAELFAVNLTFLSDSSTIVVRSVSIRMTEISPIRSAKCLLEISRNS